MNKDAVVLIGRVALAALFIIAGFGKIMGFEGTVKAITGAGMPMPQLMAAGAVAVELGGGILLLIGWKARWAALAIAAFTVVATLIFHAFWSVPPEQMMMQRTNFLKNLAIIGGLLMVYAYGPGRLSVDKG